MLLASAMEMIQEQLPTDLMQFRALFCCWIAFALLRFHPAQARFYRWLKMSGTEPSRTRGFGYSGRHAFGLLSMPALTMPQFHLSCVLMVVCLILAACPLLSTLATKACLLVALVLYF